MTKWDERYQTEDYIFGTEPNEFIAAHFRASIGSGYRRRA